ncbi:hypothetical protein [Azospirillum halopraeferens]|uniref:hypothetical protein n=1 Tax=Azospirillum halopraeferens TaxID=34010 RepID=UPI0012EB2DC8|nr:hypothetical protein [Azospirillum halopraeferens]
MSRKPRPWERISIRTKEEVEPALASIGLTVPSRKKGTRKQWQKEDWCLRRYILTLASGNLLDYPIEIMASESPDYLLMFPNRLPTEASIQGIEVTEATTNAYQKWLNDVDNDVIIPLPNGLLPDCPEKHNVGSYINKLWVEAVNKAAIRKFSKLASGEFDRVSACDILIYDNMASRPLGDWGWSEVLRMLKGLDVQENKNSCRCGSVNVISGDLLLCDIFGDIRMMRLMGVD